MNKKTAWVISLVLLLGWVMGGVAWSQDLKNRMRDRLPEIVALKAKGQIGENNKGYLAVRNGGDAAKVIVANENDDRRLVYKAIAKKTNTSLEVVGQRRAIQIAEKADKGVWLQNTSGHWYQKP